jgi:hypothetical protein
LEPVMRCQARPPDRPEKGINHLEDDLQTGAAM